MPCVGAPEGRTRGAARPAALLRATVPAAKWLHHSGRWQPQRGGRQYMGCFGSRALLRRSPYGEAPLQEPDLQTTALKDLLDTGDLC
jgi:hypothetical protein